MGLSFYTYVIFFLLYFHLSSINCWSLDQISLAPSLAPQPVIVPNSESSSTVFNVMSLGAVGDGVTDDTQAFKMAWDSACQSDEPAKLLVPKHYSFLIQSTIFTGSCGNSVVFQVIM